MKSLAATFDVAVIGGGIIGAGIARDAARRGLSVVIIERADFGSGTTATSTRLIHGGLRYLASADFRLVRLDLRERETLLRIAPHLIKPLAFVLPFFRGYGMDAIKLRLGMLLYDALSFDKTLPRHRVLNAEQMGRMEPAFEAGKVDGGAVYYDAQIHSPERLTLENVIDAAEHGAVPLNYAEVTGALFDGDRLSGVSVKDSRSGEDLSVRARAVVNAAGPWFDRVASRLGNAPSRLIRMTKGVHVACEAFTKEAVVLESAVDRRVVFAIPWSGFTWLGTTDTDFDGDPATASATEEDVRYLIDSVAPFLPGVLHARRYWSSAGVRALVRAGGSSSKVSRMHRVVTDVPGLVSVLGGKITGYRAIAEEVTNTLCSDLGMKRECSTDMAALPGGGKERSRLEHLNAIYGSRAVRVQGLVDQEPALGAPLAPVYPDIAAEVVFSVRHEWCKRLEDFMLRRSYLGFQPDRGVEAAEPASRWMGRELGWSEERRVEEVRSYRARLASDLFAASSPV